MTKVEAIVYYSTKRALIGIALYLGYKNSHLSGGHICVVFYAIYILGYNYSYNTYAIKTIDYTCS